VRASASKNTSRHTLSVCTLCNPTELELGVLAALPPNVGRALWLTAAGVEAAIEIPYRVALNVLSTLHAARLVESDDRYPPAFARTLWGDVVLSLRNSEPVVKAAYSGSVGRTLVLFEGFGA
jgi:hypothetical protein